LSAPVLGDYKVKEGACQPPALKQSKGANRALGGRRPHRPT